MKYFCSHLFTALSFDQRGQVRVCCNNYEVQKTKMEIQYQLQIKILVWLNHLIVMFTQE